MDNSIVISCEGEHFMDSKEIKEVIDSKEIVLNMTRYGLDNPFKNHLRDL